MWIVDWDSICVGSSLLVAPRIQRTKATVAAIWIARRMTKEKKVLKGCFSMA